MSIREWRGDRGLVVATCALVVAMALVLWSLAGALRPVAVAAAAPGGLLTLPPAARTVSAAPSSGIAPLAPPIDDDPFSPDRSPPETRYRLPDADADARPDSTSPQAPVVVGTAVATDGRSFAVVRLGDGEPRTLRVGDTIGPYTVRAIARNKVTFGTPSSRGNAVSPRP